MRLGASLSLSGVRSRVTRLLAFSLVMFACGERPAEPDWVDLLVPSDESPGLCSAEADVIECVEARWGAYRHVLENKPIPRGTDALLCLVRLCAKRSESEVPPITGPWRRACAAYREYAPVVLAHRPFRAGDCRTSDFMWQRLHEIE